MRIQPRHIIRQDQTSSPSIWFIKPCRCVHLRTQKTERERIHFIFRKNQQLWTARFVGVKHRLQPTLPAVAWTRGPIDRHSIHQLTQIGLANPNSTSGGVDISKIINVLFMLRTILHSSLHNTFFVILLRHHFLLLHHQQLPLVPLRNRPSTVDSKRTASNDFRQVSDDLSCLLYPKSTKASRHRK